MDKHLNHLTFSYFTQIILLILRTYWSSRSKSIHWNSSTYTNICHFGCSWTCNIRYSMFFSTFIAICSFVQVNIWKSRGNNNLLPPYIFETMFSWRHFSKATHNIGRMDSDLSAKKVRSNTLAEGSSLKLYKLGFWTFVNIRKAI